MKNILIYIILIIANAPFASERINMTCKFDAIAYGYDSFIESTNMLLTNENEYGVFLNEDATIGKYWDDKIIGNKYGSISIIIKNQKYDVSFPDTVDNNGKNHLQAIGYAFNINIGNLECTWKKGWDSIDKGTRSPESILRVIRNHINEFQHIYTYYLGQDPNVGGKIQLTFTIDHSGDIIAISVHSSNIKNTKLLDAIKYKATLMKFDPIKRGQVTVTYALILQSNDQ